jgi:hypothetical protein
MELELMNLNDATTETEISHGIGSNAELIDLQLALVGGGIGNCELG